jgi:hypothetical protein
MEIFPTPTIIKEILMFLTNELASMREMNVQLTNDMSQLKKPVSQRQHDHHVLKSVPQERGWSALFLFRIAGRYNLKVNPQNLHFL